MMHTPERSELKSCMHMPPAVVDWHRVHECGPCPHCCIDLSNHMSFYQHALLGTVHLYVWTSAKDIIL